MLANEQLVLDAATVDAAYVGRFASSLEQSQDVGPIASLCMVGYFALFIHESYQQLKKLDRQAAQQIALSPDAMATVERSRHSLKLFEDTSKGLEGQLDYFGDEIIPAHRAAFIDSIRMPFLRFLGKDLGIFSYAGVPITTSHAATFALGIDPQTFSITSSGLKLRELITEYGWYLAQWGAQIDPAAMAFPSYMRSDQLASKDVRARVEYNQRFNGAGTPDVNALLSVFQGLLNTADTLLPLDTAAESQQTTVKLKYLSTYAILRSLAILLKERMRQLRPESAEAIKAMIDHPTAKLMVDGSKRRFRNVLMHYGPIASKDLPKLSLDRPLYGLVEHYFSMDFAAFDQLLSTLVAELATEMNMWAGI